MSVIAGPPLYTYIVLAINTGKIPIEHVLKTLYYITMQIASC